MRKLPFMKNRRKLPLREQGRRKLCSLEAMKMFFEDESVQSGSREGGRSLPRKQGRRTLSVREQRGHWLFSRITAEFGPDWLHSLTNHSNPSNETFCRI